MQRQNAPWAHFSVLNDLKVCQTCINCWRRMWPRRTHAHTRTHTLSRQAHQVNRLWVLECVRDTFDKLAATKGKGIGQMVRRLAGSYVLHCENGFFCFSSPPLPRLLLILQLNYWNVTPKLLFYWIWLWEWLLPSDGTQDFSDIQQRQKSSTGKFSVWGFRLKQRWKKKKSGDQHPMLL